MQIYRGKGKLYDSNRNFAGNVTYEIFDKSINESGADWQGEITPHNGIMPVGNYIIELEDGRSGPCIIRVKTTSSFELVVDSYDIEGTGRLTF